MTTSQCKSRSKVRIRLEAQEQGLIANNIILQQRQWQLAEENGRYTRPDELLPAVAHLESREAGGKHEHAGGDRVIPGQKLEMFEERR